MGVPTTCWRLNECRFHIHLQASRRCDLREVHSAVVVVECKQLHTAPRCLSMLLPEHAGLGVECGCLVQWSLFLQRHLPCISGGSSSVWRAVQELCRRADHGLGLRRHESDDRAGDGGANARTHSRARERARDRSANGCSDTRTNACSDAGTNAWSNTCALQPFATTTTFHLTSNVHGEHSSEQRCVAS